MMDGVRRFVYVVWFLVWWIPYYVWCMVYDARRSVYAEFIWCPVYVAWRKSVRFVGTVHGELCAMNCVLYAMYYVSCVMYDM